MKRSGIYSIHNTANGRRYVGSASNITARWSDHALRLRDGRHHSIILQRSWDKYGASAFEWIVIELVNDVSKLIEREQFWLDHYNAADPACGFNIARIAGSNRGVKHSEAAKLKRAASLAARTPEQKAATLEKLAAARRGWKHPPETIAKMRGQKRREETKRRIGEAHRGRPKSPEQRAKIAATLTGRKLPPQSAEWIARRVAATRATKEARGAVQ